MTNSEAIKSMRNLDDLISITKSEHESVRMAISALEENTKLKAENEQLKSRNCQSCVNKGKCAIFDNFNIDYCSDWEKGGNNGNSKNL